MDSQGYKAHIELNIYLKISTKRYSPYYFHVVLEVVFNIQEIIDSHFYLCVQHLLIIFHVCVLHYALKGLKQVDFLQTYILNYRG